MLYNTYSSNTNVDLSQLPDLPMNEVTVVTYSPNYTEENVEKSK